VSKHATIDSAVSSYLRVCRSGGMTRLQSDLVTNAVSEMLRLGYFDISSQSFQARVRPWMLACFGEIIAGDREERNDRFLEEALELTQACGHTRDAAHKLVDYTYGREIGEPSQEVGGVMVTLAALCLANGLDMHDNGETELARINQPEVIVKIRAKQAAKPKFSVLTGSLRCAYTTVYFGPDWPSML
jgi:hypothetical protein